MRMFGGVIALAVLMLIKLGMADDGLAAFSRHDEPQRYMSSDNPWAKDYQPSEHAPAVYFRNCSEAKANGFRNIRIGSPGYRPELDGDGDGLACEPYHGY